MFVYYASSFFIYFSLPRVQSLLRDAPHSLLFVLLLESHLPFYPTVQHLPMNDANR